MTSTSTGRAMGSHQSARAETTTWLTPPSILDALGPFDLDPCSPLDRPWDTAAKHYTIEDDGLAQQWGGFVWCNPPYGAEAAVWLERMAEHGNGIALIFARTETRMFFDHVWGKASSLLFIEGRLHFHYLDGTRAKANSGAPSVLVGYGDEAYQRLCTSGIAGTIIMPGSQTVITGSSPQYDNGGWLPNAGPVEVVNTGPTQILGRQNRWHKEKK